MSYHIIASTSGAAAGAAGSVGSDSGCEAAQEVALHISRISYNYTASIIL